MNSSAVMLGSWKDQLRTQQPTRIRSQRWHVSWLLWNWTQPSPMTSAPKRANSLVAMPRLNAKCRRITVAASSDAAQC